MKINLKKEDRLWRIIFQLLIIFSFASSNAILYSITFLYFFVFYIIPFNFNYKDNFYLFFISFYVLILLMMIVFKTNSDIFIAPKAMLSLFGITVALIHMKDLKIHYFSSAWALIIFQLFIFLCIIYYGFDDFPNVSPLEKIFEGKSGNGITSYLIVLQIHFFIMHIIYEKRNNSFLYFSIFFTFLISLSTYARGSLISSILIIFIAFTLFRSSKFFIVLVLSIVFSTLIYDFDGIYDLITRYTKLSKGLEDYNRTEALKQYLNKIDLKSFFLGADYTGTIIDNHLSGNPHNSIIRAHHNFGIVYIFFIIFYTALSLLITKGIRKTVLHATLILILFFRIWTEPVLFPTVFDYFYFCIILFMLTNGKKIIIT